MKRCCDPVYIITNVITVTNKKFMFTTLTGFPLIKI